MEKFGSGIRDKHPGSETLQIFLWQWAYVRTISIKLHDAYSLNDWLSKIHCLQFGHLLFYSYTNKLDAMLRIRNVYPVSRTRIFSISDPSSRRSQIRIRTKVFLTKILFLSFQKKIRDVHPGSGSWFFPHPGSRSHKGTGPRIRIRNTGWMIQTFWMVDCLRYAGYCMGTFSYSSTTVTCVWSQVLGPRKIIFSTDFNLLKNYR